MTDKVSAEALSQITSLNDDELAAALAERKKRRAPGLLSLFEKGEVFSENERIQVGTSTWVRSVTENNVTLTTIPPDKWPVRTKVTKE